MFTEREQSLIQACVDYSGTDNPPGLPGHNLMIIISKMVKQSGDYYPVTPDTYRYRVDAIQSLASEINQTARDKGWWEDSRGGAEVIALIHSELSECLEAMRNGDPDSEKIEGFSQVEEELADAVIRILDFASQEGMNIGGAILSKMKYNKSRSRRHGGKKF